MGVEAKFVTTCPDGDMSKFFVGVIYVRGAYKIVVVISEFSDKIRRMFWVKIRVSYGKECGANRGPLNNTGVDCFGVKAPKILLFLLYDSCPESIGEARYRFHQGYLWCLLFGIVTNKLRGSSAVLVLMRVS